MAADFRIVCLCGSAGALSAYIEIIHSAPADSGMAFVILSHRRIENPCWLVQILSHETQMHVEEIADGTIMRPNCVYVGPAGKDLTTDGQALWLAPVSKMTGWPNTFDIFLNSVALNARGRAVTVILSGLAKDGCAALEMLKTNGGMNYAQADAWSESMPQSAIDTGNVDYVGSPEEIIVAICKLPPLLDMLAALAAKATAMRPVLNDLELFPEPSMDDLSIVQARVRSSLANLDEARASLELSKALVRLSMDAVRHSQSLIGRSDRVIHRLRRELSGCESDTSAA